MRERKEKEQRTNDVATLNETLITIKANRDGQRTNFRDIGTGPANRPAKWPTRKLIPNGHGNGQ